MNKINPLWWQPVYNFFGEFYMEGDNSEEGYLKDKLNLTERTATDVNGVIKLLKLKKEAKILDIPCGYGRHSLELAKRGFNKVLGLDINPKHLEFAKNQGEQEKLTALFKLSEMIKLKYVDFFDVVINMCYSFGFYKNDEENLQVLRNFYKSLKARGKFLMETDVNLPYVRAKKFKEWEERTLLSGGKLEIVEILNEKTSRMDGFWTITKPSGETKTRKYSVRVYEEKEFIEMCLEVGFSKCIAYSNWKGDPYSKEKQQIIFVAEK